MNGYKKTMLITCALTLALASHISNALDAEGDALVNKIKMIYATSISASHLSNPTAEFGKWNDLVNHAIYPYVAKNSTLMGIKDTLLMKSLGQLNAHSNKLISLLPTVRGGIILKGGNQLHEGLIVRCITDLNSLKSAVNETNKNLKLEKYYTANKINAKEILLLALDRLEQTIDKAIELLKNELQNRKK